MTDALYYLLMQGLNFYCLLTGEEDPPSPPPFIKRFTESPK